VFLFSFGPITQYTQTWRYYDKFDLPVSCLYHMQVDGS